MKSIWIKNEKSGLIEIDVYEMGVRENHTTRGHVGIKRNAHLDAL
jgi:hypothetical protein